VLRRAGHIEESRAAYEGLAATGAARVAGAPAELVALHALAELTGQQDEAVRLREGLLRAKWRLTRGQFEFYWAEAAHLSGHPEPPPAEQVALAEAAALVWQERKRDLSARREETVWILGMPLFLMWRGDSVLVTHPDSLLKPVLMKEELFCALDSEGRVIAGRKAPGGHAVVRTAAETHLPWTLYVTGTPAVDRAGFLTRQRFLVLGIAVMVLFLMLGTYFIARAIRREMQVARMQSDFVAAVSHEFRSPLTSMRQLSEILAFGRISSEERKQTY